MIFARLTPDEALGAILAHTLALPGGTIKKGRTLDAADIENLKRGGIAHVHCARLEPDDMGEDEAAALIARAAAGENCRAAQAATGRANLLAGCRGIMVVDRERLDRLNAVDEAVTLATLPPYKPVEPDEVLATVKIIPFAVRKEVAETCAAFAAGREALIRIAPLKPRRAVLIQTLLPGIKESVLDGTLAATRGRLRALGSDLVLERRCPHDEIAVARVLKEIKVAKPELILISGASATVDRRDLIPAAIGAAGGRILHFGMPVDPGNLLLLAEIDGNPVVDMPGCARSPKPNGFDWVLERLCADLPLGPKEIMAMGGGGLLKDIPSRPAPRRRTDTAPLAAPAPKIAAILLAAGRATRMGSNKLLAPVAGKPMLAHVLAAASASRARPVILVTGHEAEKIAALAEGSGAKIVPNPDYAAGLSASLRAGLDSLPGDIDGVLVLQGDMPRLSGALLDRLIGAFAPAENRAIVVPVHGGRRGNPVLFGREYFAEMRTVEGDVGARHLLGEHGARVHEIDVGEDSIFLDIDTPDALAKLEGGG